MSRAGLISLGLLAIGLAGPAYAGIDEDIENAFKLGGGKYGRVNLDVRYRYEFVDQAFGPTLLHSPLSSVKLSPVTQDANASTLRWRLGYLTPSFAGITGFAEYAGTQDIFVNDYNSTRNGKTAFPIVADPQTNRLNQLWVNYAGLPDSNIKVGRQRIVFDNHRFIGDVGWRQMQQTFDSAFITNKSLPDTTISAGYLWKVQDITSRTIDVNAPVFNIAYTGLPFGKLIAHGEWLDYDKSTEFGASKTGFGLPGPKFKGKFNSFLNSTKTVGVRFDGSTPITDDIAALYTAEYAYQADYKQNPAHYHTNYWLGEAGVNLYGVVLKGAYEELGANNGVGFATPLATLHAFQGWADKFLVTPKDGIRDVYGTAKTTLLGIEWTAMYHEFNSASGNVHYGKEFDVQAEKKFGKHYSVLVKFADYSADQFATDTKKVWMQGAINF